jgi:hypothetical protein
MEPIPDHELYYVQVCPQTSLLLKLVAIGDVIPTLSTASRGCNRRSYCFGKAEHVCFTHFSISFNLKLCDIE